MIQFRICKDINLILIQIFDAVTLQEIIEAGVQCCISPDWSKDLNVLVDQREMDGPLPMGSYSELVSFISSLKLPSSVKHVLLVNSHLEEAMNDYWIELAKIIPFQYRSFMKLDDAAQWLDIPLEKVESLYSQ